MNDHVLANRTADCEEGGWKTSWAVIIRRLPGARRQGRRIGKVKAALVRALSCASARILLKPYLPRRAQSPG